MLDVKRLALSRGGRTLLRDASFLINKGDKVGLVGVNGAGKTTLLHALRGATDPDVGLISRPKRMGYLGQERLSDDLLEAGAANGGAPVTVRDVMLAGRDLSRLSARLRSLEAQLAEATEAETAGVAVAAPAASGRKGQQAPASALDTMLWRYGELEEEFQR